MDCGDIPSKTVGSIPEFLHEVATDVVEWHPTFPWFRGEPRDSCTPLTPMIFRTPRRELHYDQAKLKGHHYDENNLLQRFRRRAHLMGLPIVPLRRETDKWLFLARHVGLPTRLLDWTESAIIGLYFALFEAQPVVWMLNPYELNRRSAADAQPNAFPITWDPGPNDSNIGFKNVAAAWRLGTGALDLPVAIEPTNIHPRMNAQHSYFTVHGKLPKPLCELVGPGCLKCYVVDIGDRDAAFRDLRRMGVAQSTVMPDAEGLAAELRRTLIVPD